MAQLYEQPPRISPRWHVHSASFWNRAWISLEGSSHGHGHTEATRDGGHHSRRDAALCAISISCEESRAKCTFCRMPLLFFWFPRCLPSTPPPHPPSLTHRHTLMLIIIYLSSSCTHRRILMTHRTCPCSRAILYSDETIWFSVFPSLIQRIVWFNLLLNILVTIKYGTLKKERIKKTTFQDELLQVELNVLKCSIGSTPFPNDPRQ